MTEAFPVARHGLQHVGGFAELTAGERRLGHRAHQSVDRLDLAEIERLQRDQTIGYRIVQLAVDARAFLVIAFEMMAMRRNTFLLQGTNLRMENQS